ncbi:MAG TPA: hypothetical protein VMX79_09755 [bacterium]|nr:hypothetical protein [bacterium]
MRTAASLAALICMGVVGAWSADCIVDGAPSHFAAAARAGSDATLELKWDNGTRLAFFATGTGAGYWVGNDWDLSAIPRYRAITKIKVYSCGDWPNRRWDGFRLGIYAFAGGTPGSLLWGPTYFKPTRTGDGWCNYSMGWTLPAGNRAFAAAAELYYNWPNCDSFALDTNPTFLNHSWRCQNGRWEKLPRLVGDFRNLMLRVVVNNTAFDIAPTSVGRVKALYY